MHIVRVVPLAAFPSTAPQVLDYFWTTPLSRGALVRVKVGRRAVEAVVLESLDVMQGKLSLKKSSFALKRLDGVISEVPQVTAGQLALAEWMAHHYAVGLSQCMKSVLPNFIGKRGGTIELSEEKKSESTAKPTIILTQPDTALAEIKKIIKSAKGQTLVLVPEITLAKYLAEQFTDATLVHSGMKIGVYRSVVRGVADGSVSVVVGTRTALGLPWQQLTQVIVEDPQHEFYKGDMTPKYNGPDAARALATYWGAKLTMLTPALNAVYRHLELSGGIILKEEKPQWPGIVMIDAKPHPGVLAPQTQDAIDRALADKKKILLYSPRKAYSTAARCERCKASMPCPNCSSPLRVHRLGDDTMLVCYHCGIFLDVPKQCPTCKAGRLKASGLAGSQKIAEAVRQLLDRRAIEGASLHIIDSDLVQTDAQEVAAWAAVDKAKQPIVVATQLVLGQRYLRTFDLIVVVEADALALNPDFRTHERVIRQLEMLADMQPEQMYLQYWDASGALAHAVDRSWDVLLDEELKDRKALKWPPYSRLVRLAYSNADRGRAVRDARTAAERLTRAAAHVGVAKKVSLLGPAPALVERTAGRWHQSLVLKTSLGDDELARLLAHTPPGAMIDVDPRSIA